jgi:hypothetical protein
MNERDRSFMLAIGKAVHSLCKYTYLQSLAEKGLFLDSVRPSLGELMQKADQLANWVKEYDDM